MTEPIDSYRVVRYEHGIAILGPVPISEFIALAESWREDYDFVDSRVAEHLRASLVVTTVDGSRQWRAELGLEAREDSDG